MTTVCCYNCYCETALFFHGQRVLSQRVFEILAGGVWMCSEAPCRIEALCYPALAIRCWQHPPLANDFVFKTFVFMMNAFKAFCENVHTSRSLDFIATPGCQNRRGTVLCSTSLQSLDFLQSVLECGLQLSSAIFNGSKTLTNKLSPDIIDPKNWEAILDFNH